MSPASRLALRLLCVSWFMFAAGAIAAGAPGRSYEPSVGQAGKDVVWVPSTPEIVELMLDIARVTPRDFVVDLGSGDGRNVIAAARRGARALGVEYNRDLVELSRRAAAAARVADRATFVEADMYKADISQASVLALFLTPENLIKLAPSFLALKPGTRIVSNTFEIGGGWEPDQTEVLSDCARWCAIHLYVVPARVAGTWRMGRGVLRLEQQFQHVAGTLETGGVGRPLENVVLRGGEFHFTVDGVRYSGRVDGDSIAGVANGESGAAWTAARAHE